MHVRACTGPSARGECGLGLSVVGLTDDGLVMPDNPDDYVDVPDDTQLEVLRSKWGREHTYDEAKANIILQRMSTGLSLRKSCLDTGILPTTVRRWALLDNPKGFAQRYAQALDLQMQAWAEDIVEIGDDSSGDLEVTEDGRPYMNGEFVARSKLRMDARKWVMARIGHQRWGDRVKNEVSGPNGGPIETRELTAEEAAQRLAEMGLPTQVLDE